ncbi:MAG TPA: hypothetical protein VGS80_13485 [Ktedonobacterales bacterium]|nr:hypothetical protein [Ktedonobacterales bacterium]
MAKHQTAMRTQARRRLPLSARLSLLVLFAALVPLAAVVGINDYFARGTLVQQGIDALSTNAKANGDLVATYLKERSLDGLALTSLPTTPALLACTLARSLPPAQAAAINAQAHCDDPNLGIAFDFGSNCRAVHVGLQRDLNYTAWALFDARGDQLLSSVRADCQPVSLTPVAREDLAAVGSGKPRISAVYYDPKGKHAYVNLYTPVSAFGQVLGFERATLNLDYVYSIINAEATNSGTQAFITDENGVRIASSDPATLFTAIQPLDANTLQAIASEQRYGSAAPVPQVNLPAVASTLQAPGDTGNFQSPLTAGGSTAYQFVRYHLHVIVKLPNPANATQAIDLPLNTNWTYFVLSPLPTVTQVADDQIKTSLLSAGVIAILAVLIGLLIGRRTATPVQEATGDLEGASAGLKLLASRQQASASEQQWVVDACKTGLDSVRYLADAMNQAARRIVDASNWFNEYWDRLTEDQAKRTVQYLLELGRYVDEAARRQHASSERLDKAITVTIQVSDQLVAGATAATQSADQLEQVVTNLQHVVGGRASRPAGLEHLEQADQVEALGLLPAPGGRSGRLDMPMPQGPQGPRALAAAGAQQGMAPMANGSWRGYAPRAPRAPWNAGQPSQVFEGQYQNSPYPGGQYASNPNSGGLSQTYDQQYSQGQWPPQSPNLSPFPQGQNQSQWQQDQSQQDQWGGAQDQWGAPDQWAANVPRRNSAGPNPFGQGGQNGGGW